MSKTIAFRAFHLWHDGQKTSKTRRQRGISLIELMVGMAIGLLVVAVAGGALMASRGISGTVSDASALQQQAGYVLRTIGHQLRQAGSLYLNLNPHDVDNAAIDQYVLPVAFEAKVPSSKPELGFSPKNDTLSGTANSLTLGYRRYSEPVFKPQNEKRPNEFLSRNCVGGPEDDTNYMRVESIFSLRGSDLRCRGNAVVNPQPIVGNVASFRVRYLRVTDAGSGNPQTRYVDADIRRCQPRARTWTSPGKAANPPRWTWSASTARCSTSWTASGPASS
ncbi:MAG: PilW family protein [Comamonas sp.]